MHVAKNTRGGLGRGLNSLLGGLTEESAPSERIRVEPTEAKPPEARSTPAADSAGSDDKARALALETLRPALPTEEEILGEENVTIKSVSVRKPEEIPIDSISPNPDQPRMSFKREELEELADSIEKKGLLQPILVREVGRESYQIIAGERRWQACKLIGMTRVPVRVRDANAEEALELALVENIQRSDLNPIEEAYGYRRIMEHQSLTQAELAQMLSKGRSTIANALRLLDLPEDAQQLLFEEKITAGHARAILSVPTAEGRQKLTEKLVSEKLSVRETESLARLLSARPEPRGAAKRSQTPKSFKIVARSLRDALLTNVKVKTVQGKNKIEIEFEDEADLERIFKSITEGIETATAGNEKRVS